MADIKYEYSDKKHKLTTYDEIIDSYNWIVNAIKHVCKDIKIKEIACVISFFAGKMSYECKNLDEFKKYAFGKEIDLRDFCIFTRDESLWGSINVYAKYRNTEEQIYTISSYSEVLITDMVTALRTEAKPSEPHMIPVNVKIEDKSVHIGDGNTINQSIIGQNKTDSEKVGDQNKEKVGSKIFWNIIIPIIVGIVVIAIAVWLGLQN